MRESRAGATARARAWLDRLAAHPWLIGDPSMPGSEISKRARWMTLVAILTANVVGVSVVVCFSIWVLPKPEAVLDAHPEIYWLNIAMAVAYTTAALVAGAAWGRRQLDEGPEGMREWLDSDRPPSPEERLRVLRVPLRIMKVHAVLWGAAVVGFAALNAAFSGLLALGVGLTVALGGLTTSAAAYLLGELALRPIASRALAAGGTDRRGVPGVATRWLLAWALGTAVPIVGLVLVGIVALTDVPISKHTLAVTTLTLCGFGLGFGALVSVLAAYATVHPISSIRGGLARVRAGDLDVQLGVWDSTEMGLLQAGFNEMVTGLRERERIRDLFGRQVGEDVARQALVDDVRLGGETREVAVLFVDLLGSTALAAERPPQDVVALLNRFFGEVVEVVEEHGGWINKFQGDAALAIFGAPAPVADAEGKALRAARALDARLRERVGELSAGIGVAVGPAVAGHIGAERRFEYTVIGDPVNEAARLTELAKREPCRVLASSAVVARAGNEEAGRWELGEPVLLRGRASATQLARPRGEGVSESVA